MEDLEPAAAAAMPGLAVAPEDEDAVDDAVDDGGGNVEDAGRSDLSPLPPVEDAAADAADADVVEAEEEGAAEAAEAEAKAGSFEEENMFFDMLDMVCMREG